MSSLMDTTYPPIASQDIKKTPDMEQHDMTKVESYGNGEYFPTSEQAGTKRNIKSRHAQMIAIGGSIGTGLFLGAGQALAIGGPGVLFLAYAVMAMLVYMVVTAVIEVGTYLPISGSSMAYFATRYVSRSVGFALGWLYFYSFGIIVAYELTAASILIDYWPNDVHIAVWITIMMVVVVGLNLFPVGVYAEAEFWFAGIKIVMLVGMIFMSIVLMLGGGPNHDRLGFRYWNHPGAVNAYIIDGAGGRFTAFLYVLVFSAFSFNFSAEQMVFTAGEMRHPRKNLPSASRRFFARLVVFYIIGTLCIGIVCKSNSKGLTSSAGDASASPWVIAARNAGITVLPSIINAGILTSAWSAGNSYLYMSSRSLYSLAVAGSAPRIFTRCNRGGLPIYAVLASSCFCPLAYLNCSTEAGIVFNWFINLTNTAGYTSFIVSCIIFFRFRKAAKAQGVSPPYQSWMQPYGAGIALVAFVILLLCNGFTLFYPGHWNVQSFLTTYIGIPIFLVLYAGHKILVGLKDPWLHRPEDVDLTTGVKEVEEDTEMWERVEQQELEKNGQPNIVWRIVSSIWS